jgi:hypothetical protein
MCPRTGVYRPSQTKKFTIRKTCLLDTDMPRKVFRVSITTHRAELAAGAGYLATQTICRALPFPTPGLAIVNCATRRYWKGFIACNSHVLLSSRSAHRRFLILRVPPPMSLGLFGDGSGSVSELTELCCRHVTGPTLSEGGDIAELRSQW